MQSTEKTIPELLKIALATIAAGVLTGVITFKILQEIGVAKPKSKKLPVNKKNRLFT